jgi:hypothetical protein
VVEEGRPAFVAGVVRLQPAARQIAASHFHHSNIRLFQLIKIDESMTTGSINDKILYLAVLRELLCQKFVGHLLADSVAPHTLGRNRGTES